MSSLRTALVAAMLEAPQDDTPRLVAADWFEEQGGEANTARAEFIRIQIERANRPPDDLRQSELQARELRLLKRWAPVWCGAHFVFKKVRFRRGFIDYVHVHLQHFLHHRRQMFALEPVRDVRLTGFFRAPDDLVRRVAACEELKNIETLRIHHQGPHRHPCGNLVDLLESPHWTRLRALHCLMVQFNAEERRRFERLAILRRLTELHLPFFETFPNDPGEWFSDGGAAFAAQWGEIKSLSLPDYVGIDLLRQFSEMPFWNRLTAISLSLPGSHLNSEAFSILRDRLPNGLQELCLSARISPDDYSQADPFFQRLAHVPLQSLHLEDIPVRGETLARLLDSTSRWQLRKLTLRGEVADDCVRVLARSPGIENLHSLDLAGYGELGSSAAQALFSSDSLHSLVHLTLGGVRIGTEGAIALAKARGIGRLRSLSLSGSDLGREGLRALLASPVMQSLTCLTLDGANRNGQPSLDIAPETATGLLRLPHLAYLQLRECRCPPRSQELLAANESLPWLWIENYDEPDIHRYRANRAPERFPPVDVLKSIYEVSVEGIEGAPV